MRKKNRFSKFITTPCPLFPLQDNITDISGQQFHRSAHLLAKILIFYFILCYIGHTTHLSAVGQLKECLLVHTM